jgi:transposase
MKGGAFMAQHPDAAKQRRWLALIRMWLDSDLCVRDFCHRHRLKEPCFYAWRRTLSKRGLLQLPAPAAFVQLTASPPPPSPPPSPSTPTAAEIELVLDQRLTLRVRPGFDPDTLQRLLRLLQQKEPSC